MIPSEFDYTAPESIEEALAALAQAGDDGKILAGGQSLIPILRLRMNTPEQIIDLGRIPALREVTEEGDTIVIGATATHEEVRRHPLVQEHAGLLSQTLAQVGDPQVRHRGTLGGALAHADPAGDLGSAAVALDAEFEIAGADGRRTVAAADFFEDYLTTAIGEGEVLVSVSFPKSGDYKTHYQKFNRMAQAWATVGVAVAIKVDGDTISDARVGLTNMGSVPLRASGVEAELKGKPATDETFKAAAEKADEGTSPTDDLSAKADYRKHLAKVLTRRALEGALKGKSDHGDK